MSITIIIETKEEFSSPSTGSPICQGTSIRRMNQTDNADDDPGEWTMIVSRFHFVDLPGIVFFINFFPVADDVSSSSRLRRPVNVSWRVFRSTTVNPSRPTNLHPCRLDSTRSSILSALLQWKRWTASIRLLTA